MKKKTIKIKKGRLKGESFKLEGELTEVFGHDGDSLAYLATAGNNWAARNALEIDNYTIDDAPFYYGKIGSLGYILSAKDLGI